MKPYVKPMPKEMTRQEPKTIGMYVPNLRSIFISCNQKQTLETIWHEEMHKILCDLFDYDTSFAWDNKIFYPEKKDSLAHELGKWFFGDTDSIGNYASRKTLFNFLRGKYK